MTQLLVPVTPNAPLQSPFDEEHFGRIELRRQRDTGFVENEAFDAKLLTYDTRYQNSQAHSEVFRSHMRDVSEVLMRRYGPNIRVVEIGCGKGDFIDMLEARGFVDVRGFDTAYEGSRKNIECRYIGPNDRLDADLIILRHVLEHVERPHVFMDMLAAVFGLNCHVYIEVPCLNWIVQQKAYFDITYEHVNYFTAASLSALFDHELLESGALFGQQYIYAISMLRMLSPSEFQRAYDGGNWEAVEFFHLFPDIDRQIRDVRNRLWDGRNAYVWGAATKGCLFSYYLTLRGGSGRIAFAIDSNPNKVGRFLPGTKIPIVAKEHFFRHASADDLLLIPNPNYRAEIEREVNATHLAGMEILCV